MTMMLETGHVLQDRYRIDGLLGKGGMGAVYRALDLRLNHVVAIKENLEFDAGGAPLETAPAAPPTTSPEDRALTESRREQFEREAQILARLRHSGLPKVTDHFVIPHQGQYLVMEYIEGRGLNELIEEGHRFEPDDAVRIGVDTCAVLVYLHALDPPIIHRDIKPANLRMTPNGRTVLVDFGIAKEGDAGLTRTGALGVTPGYSPMEQYAGTGQTDGRSDVYALGATLHALLGGGSPPTATDRFVGKPVEKLAGSVPGVSQGLQMLVEKAMELKPESRFQSAQEFRDALEEYLLSRPATAQPGAAPAYPSPDETKIPGMPAPPSGPPPGSEPISVPGAADIPTELAATRPGSRKKSFFEADEAAGGAFDAPSTDAPPLATTERVTDAHPGPAAHPTQPPHEKKGGGKKWLWVPLLLLLGVGGYAAYQQFLAPSSDSADRADGTIPSGWGGEDDDRTDEDTPPDPNGADGQSSIPTKPEQADPEDDDVDSELDSGSEFAEDLPADAIDNSTADPTDDSADNLTETPAGAPTEESATIPATPIETATPSEVPTQIDTPARIVTLVELHISDDPSFQPSDATLFRQFMEETEEFDLYQALRPKTLLGDQLFAARFECGKTFYVKGKSRTVDYAERSSAGRWDRVETSVVETEPCPDTASSGESESKPATQTAPPPVTETTPTPTPTPRTIPALSAVGLQPASGVTEAAFQVTWTRSNSSAFQAYEIEIAKDRTFQSILHEQRLEGFAGQNSVLFQGLECSADYFYRVRVLDTHGQDALSDIGTVTTLPCPFPNPVVVNLSGTGSFPDLDSAVKAINRDPNAPAMTRIELAPGTYPMNGDLWLGKPIEIQGKQSTLKFSNGRVVLQTTGATLRGLTIESATNSAVNVPSGKLVIENCQLTSSAMACVDVYGSGEVEIRDSTIQNSPSKGILLRGQAKLTAQNCQISGNESGLDVTQAAVASLRDCTVSRSKQSGVYIHDGGQATLVGCTLEQNTFSGIAIKRNSTARLERCQIIDNQQFGLVLDATGRATLTGTDVLGNLYGSMEEEVKGSVTADNASKIE